MMAYTAAYNSGEDLPILTGSVQGGKISINLTPNLPQALTEGGLKTASLFVTPAAAAAAAGRKRLQSAPVAIDHTPAVSTTTTTTTYYSIPNSLSFHQLSAEGVTPAQESAHLYTTLQRPQTQHVETTLAVTTSSSTGALPESDTLLDGSDVTTEELMSFFTQVAKITDHLYLCAAAAVTPTNISQNGITHVINLTVDVLALRSSAVETTRIAIDDVPSANLGIYFDQLTDKIRRIKERGGRTLVHCVAGVSRSSSTCIAYLMKYYRMPLLDAYRYVKGRRPVVRPNAGFFRQLIDFERRLFGVNTVRMVDSSVGQIPDVYMDEVKGMVPFHQTAPLARGSRQRPVWR